MFLIISETTKIFSESSSSMCGIECAFLEPVYENMGYLNRSNVLKNVEGCLSISCAEERRRLQFDLTVSCAEERSRLFEPEHRHIAVWLMFVDIETEIMHKLQTAILEKSDLLLDVIDRAAELDW